MKRETAFIAAAALALALPACEYFDKGPTTPAPSPSPATAALSIAVAPDPLKILWVCPIADTYCFGSLDSTGTVTGRAIPVSLSVRLAILATRRWRRNPTRLRRDRGPFLPRTGIAPPVPFSGRAGSPLPAAPGCGR